MIKNVKKIFIIKEFLSLNRLHIRHSEFILLYVSGTFNNFNIIIEISNFSIFYICKIRIRFLSLYRISCSILCPTATANFYLQTPLIRFRLSVQNTTIIKKIVVTYINTMTNVFFPIVTGEV